MNLLEAVWEKGNPLISGERATFVWEGESAPHLVSDLHDWERDPRPLKKSAANLWTISLDLPADTYLEYTFYDPASGARLSDPFNYKSVDNGVGGYNQFFYMPGAQPTPYAKTPAGGLRGRLTRHVVDAEWVTGSRKRRVSLYHPPVRQAVPLLVVYDGPDYARRGHLSQIVDNLIAEKRIPPIAIAFLQNGGAARAVEYSCSDATLDFVMDVVLPLASRELKLLDYKKDAGVHGVLGSSSGGLMSAYTALRLPEVFGRALSQSGAFELRSVILPLVRHLPRPDVKLWLDCGRLDKLLDDNRTFSTLLAEQGYSFTFRENGGAHNFTTWRDHVADGLEWLFKA